MLSRYLVFIVSVMVIFLAVSGSALAGRRNPSPEIDPGSMASAMVLLAASGAVVVDSIRRKFKRR